MGWHTRPGDEAIFTNIYEPSDIQRVISRMKRIAEQLDRKGGLKSIVIGMPNTGKSSMLNVIRRHATDRKCKNTL
jgi:ribosome biogenesis GTPase A